jgi:multisubunit Na+/H+ antiporter MnhG subunit
MYVIVAVIFVVVVVVVVVVVAPFNSYILSRTAYQETIQTLFY